MSDAVRTFEVRHLQLARALFAALAAVMITFSPDHSAEVGLAVFSGFAIATALVFFVAVWLVFPAGRRATPVLLGVLSLVAGIVGGLPAIRSTTLFFVLVIAWAFVTGIVEFVSGLLGRRRADGGGRRDAAARDAILIGALTIVLALGLLLVNPAYSLDYFIDQAGWFTLTGITIGVGVFGGYAAIVAVFLGIAGFSPRHDARAAAAIEITETTETGRQA